MRTKIIQSLLPFAAILFAIVSTFAFSTPNAGMTTLYSGHKKVGTLCIDTGVLCTDKPNAIICKDATGATLYKRDLTSCIEQLWKPLP